MKLRNPNYMRRVLEEGKAVAGQPGVHHVVVMHDDWCSQLAGKGPCDCNPDVRMVPSEVQA